MKILIWSTIVSTVLLVLVRGFCAVTGAPFAETLALVAFVNSVFLAVVGFLMLRFVLEAQKKTLEMLKARAKR